MSDILNDWYTDSMDVFRVSNVKEGSITKKVRNQVLKNLPCRIYNSSKPGPTFTETTANLAGQDKLACDVQWDIRSGDELLITRGKTSDPTGSRPPIRYFVGGIQYYYDNFADIDHQEMTITSEERA